MTPQYHWYQSDRGPILFMEYGGLLLHSPPLWSKTAGEGWKHILLDRFHRMKTGKQMDGVTQDGPNSYLVAGLL